ncbi:glycosyltransferase family 88 protein [Legionella sp. km535]|uniref:glycosyltransferase family 88 protein n=1 Tax=Legionella sp. km535 TaxID=2498107 RepID=UPI001F3319D9|nr:glycosyltransferase family 88 protein [Legionella sp. km535]
MSDSAKKVYQYNPHLHVKIWLSNKPGIFMNTENQMRLISMREKNPTDSISLIYDSSLLNEQALKNLYRFCAEHRITPVDAHQFPENLTTENEKKLYEFYRDEITHLSEGGNLAVASDILRWLSPVYSVGAYTDFDVPVDTSKLPARVSVKAPLLLNIGSLRIRNKDIILSNNDYIAIVDPNAAKEEIEKVQQGIIQVLSQYTNDFIENTEEEFGRGSYLNKYLISFMRNRSESIYIARSKNIFTQGKEPSSRELRKYINEIMNDPIKFLDFNKVSADETHQSVTQRLRKELKDQLGFFKWLFFRNEYYEIKGALQQSDEKLLAYLMKKERTLYLKSIVVCTTGPIAIAKFLFNGYVFTSRHFDQFIQQYSFNHYGLKKAFQSQNSISMRESVFGMMTFLGSEDGKLNDSSWLETGAQLQKSRGELLEIQKNTFEKELPGLLHTTRKNVEQHIKNLESNLTGFWGLFFPRRKQEKIKALQQVLACFQNDIFDTNQFRDALKDIHLKKDIVYAGLFYSQTKNLIESLEKNCMTAIVFGLTTNRTISLQEEPKHIPVSTQPTVNTTEAGNEPVHTPGLGLFEKTEHSPTPVPSLATSECRLNR